MELIRGIAHLQPRHHGCVATLGKFDGIHRGHQAILHLLRQKSREYGLPATVITFEPQPEEFFIPEQAPARLTRLPEKLRILEEEGVERVLCLRFNHAFAALPPMRFIDEVLVTGLGVRYLIVGKDFRFGHRREGDFSTLARAGRALYNQLPELAFETVAMPTVMAGMERVSSSRVREALEQGNLPHAAWLLGRPYSWHGRVIHGEKLGRRLGFPTANIAARRAATPMTGVFSVYMHGIAPRPWPGVANLGTRPTAAGVRLLLEVHLFDFNQNIYGRHVCVEFVRKLRDERKFVNLDALTAQIHEDVRHAQQQLVAPPNTGVE